MNGSCKKQITILLYSLDALLDPNLQEWPCHQPSQCVFDTFQRKKTAFVVAPHLQRGPPQLPAVLGGTRHQRGRPGQQQQLLLHRGAPLQGVGCRVERHLGVAQACRGQCPEFAAPSVSYRRAHGHNTVTTPSQHGHSGAQRACSMQRPNDSVPARQLVAATLTVRHVDVKNRTS
jgi:hypothetical protein